MFGEQGKLRGFDLRLVFARDGHEVEGDFVEVGQRARGLVVADDERKVAAELAGLVAQQQVGQAVQVLRDEERDVLLGVGELDAPVHLELARDGVEGGAKCGFAEAGGVGGELDAHEEEAKLDILMLVGVQDVDVVAGNEKIHDGGDDSLAVGTVDEQDCDLGLGFGMFQRDMR